MIPLKRDQVIQLGASTLVITALAFAISSQIRPDILEGGVYKRLEVLFSAWNSLPLTQHYFVPFIRGEANGYADGTVHTHITQSYWVLLWGWTRTVSPLFSLSIAKAVCFFVLFYIFLWALAFSTLQTMAFKNARSVVGVLLVTAYFFTQPSLWLNWIVFTGCDAHPFAALAFTFYAFHLKTGEHWRTTLSFCFVCALFSPLYIPLLSGLIWIHQRENRLKIDEKEMHRLLALLCGVAFVAYFSPKVVFYLLGFKKDVASSFFFRSGLDGSTRYYQNPFQAMFHPVSESDRPWSLVPVFLPIVLLFSYRYFTGSFKELKIWIETGIISVLPYFFMLTFLPQAVSVHPYVFDPQLLIPTALVIAKLYPEQLQTSRMGGTAWVVSVLFFVGVILFNLTEIMRAIK